MTPRAPTEVVTMPPLTPVDDEVVAFALRIPAWLVIELMNVVPQVADTLAHKADCLPRMGEEARPRAYGT